MNINHLIFLAQKKNDLNRRRMRFYYYWNERSWHNMHTRIGGEAWHKKFMSRAKARKGYEKAQRDMKKMTKMMRKARKSIGARFLWDAGGRIAVVVYNERRIPHTQFKRYVDAHLIENILLGGKK